MENYDFKLNAEKRKAINTLVRIGLLIPYRSLKLYHGRTAKYDKPGQEWKVDPKFNNASNNTGNSNVNVVSALSTSDYKTARDFAVARNRDVYGYDDNKIDPSKAQVIKIESSDPDAMIFNAKFDFGQLPAAKRQEVYTALKILNSTNITEFSPVRFEERDIALPIFNAIKMELARRNSKLVTDEILERVRQDFANRGIRVKKELLDQLGGSLNARWLLYNYPKILFDKYVFEKDLQKRTRIDDIFASGQKGPLNLEYFASWCYSCHIIGQKSRVTSVTVDAEIDNYIIFDKTKINTERVLGDRLRKIVGTYSQIDNILAKMFPISPLSGILGTLTNYTPKQSIELMETLGYKEAFALNSKTWEKFSIGEHTETVLRVFEDTYRDEMPESLVGPMKFIILIHDIGKGYAKRDGKYSKQDEKDYTNKLCRERVFKAFNMRPEMQDLIMFIIDESQVYAANIFLPNHSEQEVKENKGKMAAAVKEKLAKVLGREPTLEEKLGLIQICKVLLACDGGAYTRYAVTRAHDTEVYYRNGNDSFTRSFDKPADIRGREVKFLEKQ